MVPPPLLQSTRITSPLATTSEHGCWVVGGLLLVVASHALQVPLFSRAPMPDHPLPLSAPRRIHDGMG